LPFSITKRFGSVTALDGVDVDVRDGEFVCLLGPSGCGKTTLLRIAAGIDKPDSGRLLFDGQEVAGPDRFVPPEKRNIGLMFQDFALFPHLPIIDNVAFGLNSLPRDEARGIALHALERVGLAQYAASYPHSLSGGEQQRVALARALVQIRLNPIRARDFAQHQRGEGLFEAVWITGEKSRF
jgi:iron(III) transport system ATP-binding protein